MKWVRVLLLLLVLGTGVLIFRGYREATADPVVRRANVGLADWPRGAPPLDVLLLSDLHVSGPDMPPERLTRIVAQANRLHPDLVLIAGDFLGSKMWWRRYSPAEAIAPLAGLRAPLGVFAVFGNHDHWDGIASLRPALARAGVHVLQNDARTVGPLALGGLDDIYTGHWRRARVQAAMRPLRGARVLLSHGPDAFRLLRGDRLGLVLAGHTHCGQIVLPLIGPIETGSWYGRKYACGRIDERGRTLIVTAGLGTSLLPLRLGAPPDMWLIALGPRAARIRPAGAPAPRR